MVVSLVALMSSIVCAGPADKPNQSQGERKSFDALCARQWNNVFTDTCTGEWSARWFLDGDKAKVTTDEKAMTIDTTHGYAVLWTKQEFRGDLRIEYDFQRVDKKDKGVNIIYIQATGDGQKGHVKDITRWADRRTKAAMSDYFQNMHTYHISYAAFPKDYVRGRRYLPESNKGLKGTKLRGEYTKTGYFNDQEWIHVTIVKQAKVLWMEFKHPTPGKTLLCRFTNDDKPAIEEGRIGLRLMPSRKSRFKNFKVMEAGKEKEQ